MSCEADTAALLRAEGLRYTSQRALILTALRHAGGHRTAAEVHELVLGATEGAGISLSTVYRTLEGLTDSAIVSVLDAGSSPATFEWSGPAPGHHHLRCIVCGRVTEVDLPLLEDLSADIRARTGFEANIRHLGLSGTCAECAAAR